MPKNCNFSTMNIVLIVVFFTLLPLAGYKRDRVFLCHLATWVLWSAKLSHISQVYFFIQSTVFWENGENKCRKSLIMFLPLMKSILEMALHGSRWLTSLLNCKMKSFSSACRLNGEEEFSVELGLFLYPCQFPICRSSNILYITLLHASVRCCAQLGSLRYAMVWMRMVQMLKI